MPAPDQTPTSFGRLAPVTEIVREMRPNRRALDMEPCNIGIQEAH